MNFCLCPPYVLLWAVAISHYYYYTNMKSGGVSWTESVPGLEASKDNPGAASSRVGHSGVTLFLFSSAAALNWCPSLVLGGARLLLVPSFRGETLMKFRACKIPLPFEYGLPWSPGPVPTG